MINQGVHDQDMGSKALIHRVLDMWFRALIQGVHDIGSKALIQWFLIWVLGP